MLKQFIFGTGLILLTALPLAAQNNNASKIEKEHPLEAPTEENPKYREQHKPKDYTGISTDPQFPNHATKPVPADTTSKSAPAPPAKKEEETAQPK